VPIEQFEKLNNYIDNKRRWWFLVIFLEKLLVEQGDLEKLLAEKTDW
jgi:hypothetical protein